MHIDFTSRLHTSTKRNYLERVAEHDKAACSEVAIQYGKEYWDGDRRYGYGGYQYDGRWLPIAKEIAKHYGLTSESRVMDVGCGKGYLLYEFTQAVPGITVAGLDISQYALDNAKEEVKPFLRRGNAVDLPYEDRSFDLVVSLGTVHNLYNYELRAALREIERVSRSGKYVVVESYRDEKEKVNLLYWQLTCRSFYTPQEWEWFFEQCGYTGDHGFMFFQ